MNKKENVIPREARGIIPSNLFYLFFCLRCGTMGALGERERTTA